MEQLKIDIINLYNVGHSIGFITQCVYKEINKEYFSDYKYLDIINTDKYHKRRYCQNLVETTIMHYNQSKRTIGSLSDIIAY